MKQNDDLFNQIVNISKAGAYDAIAPKFSELQQENEILKAENAMLKIRLKGANQMLEVYKEFMNEVKPKDAEVFELPAVDQEIEQEMKDFKDNDDLTPLDEMYYIK